jgi:hypothetical protein
MTHLNLKPLSFIAVLLFLMGTATPGWAQQPTNSMQELQSRLKADDELKIINRDGKSTTGRFVSMSGSSLTLMVKGVRQDFAEGTIREIKQRRPHGKRNLYLGAAIGGVAGGATLAATHLGSDGTNFETTAKGVMAGAGIGAGIVALKHLFTRRYDKVFVAK